MKNAAAIRTSSKNENVFVAAVWFIWLVLAAITIFNHEMWRDELQAWMLVKASPDFSSLIQNTRYEGHPLLWFFLLWVLKFFSSAPEAIQVLHFAIAAALGFVFLKFAPFGKLHRALFVFGYFPLYEYAAISRNYAIGILLLFIFCTVFQRQARNYILLSILLFFAMQASFFSLLIALALAFGFGINIYVKREIHIIKTQKMLWAVLIFLAGFALSIISILPPDDHFFGGEWRQQFSLSNIGGVITILWRNFVPIPDFSGIQSWNSNFINNLWLQFSLSVILLITSILIFRKKRWILAIFISGLFAMLLFFYMRMFGSLRHQGHIYILFVICLWLLKTEKSPSENPEIPYLESWKNAFLTVIFSLQVVAGFIFAFTDYQFPFSNAKSAARYLQHNKLDALTIVADADMIGSGVSAYLQKPVYYPLTNTFSTYITWNKDRDKTLDETTLIHRSDSISLQQKNDAVLVLSYPLKKNYPNIIQLKSYDFIVMEPIEVFYIYKLKYKQSNLTHK